MPRPSKKKAHGRKTKTKAGLDASTTTNPPPTHRTASKKVLFRLMDLPAELVLRVIRHAVVISSQEKPLRVTNEDPEAIVPPAITRTCKLFRAEGIKLFYSDNVFLARSDHGGADSLWQWLEALGARTRQRINALYVEWVDDNGSELVKLHDGELQLRAERLITLRDFQMELVFQSDHTCATIKQFFYRTQDGKVVLDVAQPGSAPRYQLSLRRGLARSDKWTSAKRYIDVTEEDEYDDFSNDADEEQAANSTDFWIAEEIAEESV